MLFSRSASWGAEQSLGEVKRFTETNKWGDPWWRRLSSPAKQLQGYLWDNCNQIGLIEVDFTLVSGDCGQKIDEANMAELGERVQSIGAGKYFLPKFIHFQYGELSESCPPHKTILKLARLHNLQKVGLLYLYPNATLALPTRQDKKGQDKTRGGTGGLEKNDSIMNSEHQAFIVGWSENYKAHWKVDYFFKGGRDGKAVKELMGLGITHLDLLEIAKKAWEANPPTFETRQAQTIHGFREYINQLNLLAKNGNTQNSRPNPRNAGVITGPPTTGYTKPRFQREREEKERLARQVAQTGANPPAT